MLTRLKQYFWIGLGLGAFYFLLANHFIFTDLKTVDLLKKKELKLNYTFYSIANKSPEEILAIEDLREAGIGDILLRRGKATEAKLDQVIRKLESE